MRESDHLDEKQGTNLENVTQIEPKTDKNQSDNRLPNIETMSDEVTMEVFKHLNYYQLATNCLVSYRFWDVIRTYRHFMPRRCVDEISMTFVQTSDRYQIHRPTVQIFDKQLIPESYNEWVFHNNYSKQIPFEGQVALKQSTQFGRDVFELSAEVVSKNPGHRRAQNKSVTRAFFAKTQVNNDNWPLFQHFVRLITDPFINIGTLELTPQNDVLKLLARSINPDCKALTAASTDPVRNRLRCEKLKFDFERSSRKFVRWLKYHVRCDEFQIYNRRQTTLCGGMLLKGMLIDLFLTGGHCTSKIDLKYYDPSKIVIGIVQKFMGLKKCDEYQIVEVIECYVAERPDEELMRKCAKFIVKEENNRDSTEHFFEFVNNDIEKKLKLSVKIKDFTFLRLSNPYQSYFVLKIVNLIV